MPLDAVVKAAAHEVDNAGNVVGSVLGEHLDNNATVDRVEVDNLWGTLCWQSELKRRRTAEHRGLQGGKRQSRPQVQLRTLADLVDVGPTSRGASHQRC